MSNIRSRAKKTDFLVYEVCHADGRRGSRLFPEEQVEKDGGVAAIEARFSEEAMWFYPLGKITAYIDEHDDLVRWAKPLAKLRKAWEKLGSPKVIGMAGKGAGLIQ